MGATGGELPPQGCPRRGRSPARSAGHCPLSPREVDGASRPAAALPHLPVPELSSLHRRRADAPKGRRSLPATAQERALRGDEGLRGLPERLEAGWCGGGALVGAAGEGPSGPEQPRKAARLPQGCGGGQLGGVLEPDTAAQVCRAPLRLLFSGPERGRGLSRVTQHLRRTWCTQHSPLGPFEAPCWGSSGSPPRAGPASATTPPCMGGHRHVGSPAPSPGPCREAVGGLLQAAPPPTALMRLCPGLRFTCSWNRCEGIPEEENQSIISEHGCFSNWGTSVVHTSGRSMAQRAVLRVLHGLAAAATSEGRLPCPASSLSCRG